MNTHRLSLHMHVYTSYVYISVHSGLRRLPYKFTPNSMLHCENKHVIRCLIIISHSSHHTHGARRGIFYHYIHKHANICISHAFTHKYKKCIVYMWVWCICHVIDILGSSYIKLLVGYSTELKTFEQDFKHPKEFCSISHYSYYGRVVYISHKSRHSYAGTQLHQVGGRVLKP